MTTIDMSTLPAFPVPDFDKVTAALGPMESAYLTREQLGEWLGMYGAYARSPFHQAVEDLFYDGKTKHRLAFKDGIDTEKARTAIRALLRSFAPQHEVKIGTVAVALANWCDLLAEEAGADVAAEEQVRSPSSGGANHA